MSVYDVEILPDPVMGVDVSNDWVYESTPVLAGLRGPQGPSGGAQQGAVLTVNGRPGPYVDGLAEADELAAVAEDLSQIVMLVPTLATQTALDAVQAMIPDVSDYATTEALAGVIELIPQPGDYATPADIAASSTADRNRANHTGQQTSGTISDFAAAADARINAQKAQPSGLATLGVDGKVPPSQISTMVTVQVYPAVPDIAAMLALPADSPGDQALLPTATYVYLGPDVGPPTLLTSWHAMAAPTDGVITVNGRNGNVTGIAEQSAVDAVLASLNAHTSNYGNPHFTTTSQVSEDSPYKRYTNDGDVARLANTYGVNTGDQDLSTYARGPASSVDNTVARFDLATGKLLQGSGVTIDDSGYIRTGTMNTPNGGTGSPLAFPGGRAQKGLVIQQTLAAGTANMQEFQRSDGGITARWDSAASLRFSAATDAGIYNTATSSSGVGEALPGSNAKNQFQPGNAGSNALGLFGYTSQTADILRVLTSLGVVMFSVGADGKLLWGPNGAQDVNIYRGGNNILATDDAFSAAGPVTGSNLSGTNTGDKQQVVNAIGNIGAARPAHNDPVIWRVTSGATPTNIDATKGDFTVSDA